MARNIDGGQLSVMLWGREIGKLCWDQTKRNSFFFFSPGYLSSGLDIAPLTAPSKSPAARFVIYGNTDFAKYQRLPPFIADSLPDDWGNTLFDQWFAEHHYHEKDKTPLAKLSFVGSRAMGALEFVPCSEDAFSPNETLMIPKLYELAKKIEQDREHAIISPEETLTQKALMAVGTSAGGRFKKAIIAMDEGGNIFSGQTSAREVFGVVVRVVGEDVEHHPQIQFVQFILGDGELPASREEILIAICLWIHGGERLGEHLFTGTTVKTLR